VLAPIAISPVNVSRGKTSLAPIETRQALRKDTEMSKERNELETRLSPDAYLSYLDSDVSILLNSTEALSARIPACPDWNVRDLYSHLVGVYRHKIVALDTGKAPEQKTGSWGDLLEDEDPREVLRHEYMQLKSRLESVPSDTPAWSWWPDEQTVGFWQRRMALETVVHRWDLQSAKLPENLLTVVPIDLANDGIDELLSWLAWPWDDQPQPEASGQKVGISTPTASWIVELHPTRVLVSREDAATQASISGNPSDVMLYLWGRRMEQNVVETGDATALSLIEQRLNTCTS
jgi:uncharacterized protein (TIGR03083 family)